MSDILLQIGAEFPGADKVNEQLNKLDRSLDESVKAANRFEREIKRLNAAKKKGTVTDQGYNAALQQSVARLLDTSNATNTQTQAIERNIQATQRATQATNRKTAAQQAARTQFLATANSIAVLDGPLGGVASRFSAFGVLIGRIGIPLAALSIGFTTLSVAATRALRSFGEFEVQLVTLENAFDNVNNKIGMSAAQISGFAEQLALNSLESADSVRRAATRLVGFGELTEETFKGVLEAAADLSASGFGALETNATRLARAIEDPVRSLRDLRTVGITFSASQEALIRTLAETGRRGEAAAMIMDKVNEAFGGAAQRQADTFAGRIDTIRQAYLLLFREIGEALEDSSVGRFFEFLSDSAELYVRSRSTPLEELEDQVKTLQELLDTQRKILAQQEAEIAKIESASGRTRRQGTETSQTRAFIRDLERDLENALAEIERLGGTTTQVADQNLSRLEDALSSINNEISELVRTSGMTDMQKFVDEVLRATETVDGLSEEVDNLREELSRTAEIKFNLQQASSLEDSLRRSTETLRESQFLAQAQLEFVGQTGGAVQTLINLRADELRVQAQIEQLQQDLKGATDETAGSIQKQINGLLQVLSNLQAAAQAAGQMAGEIDRATANANALASVMSSVASAISGARASIAGMNAEIAALESGASLVAASGIGSVATQAARLREQIGDITDPTQYAQALRQIHELERTGTELAHQRANAQERLNSLQQAARGGGGPAGGGGGGGGGGQSAMQRLMEEIDLQRQRIGLNEEELRLFEARLKVTNAARQDGISLAEEEIDRIAQMIVENEKLIEQQQRLEQARERAAQRMTDLFMAAMQGGESFRRTLGNIIQEMARMAAMRAFRTIMGGVGGGTGGGLLSFLFSANGNVFQGGNVKAFAKGGVVDGPTMFPMPGVQTGLMGEAGPEAIIPLKRNRKGELGVEGGVTSAVSVTYAPQISVKGSGEEVAALRQEIARMNAEAPARIVSVVQKAQKKRVL